MKNVIKNILPQIALNKMRQVEGMVSIAGQAQQKLEVENLVSQKDLDVKSILQSPEHEEIWAQIHQDIVRIYGDEDKLRGVNPGDRRVLFYLAHALKPQHILEVGTHIGASGIYLAKALQQTSGGVLTTLDILDVNAADAPWKHVGLHMPPADIFKALSCENHVRFLQQPALKFMAETDKIFDIIFLDGDHRAGPVYAEICAASRILSPGGLIILHDYYPGGENLYPDKNIIYGPFQSVRRLEQENPALYVDPLGKLPWATKQNTKMTSLAILMRKDGAT